MPGYSWPLMKDTLSWKDRWELAKFVLTTDRFTQGSKVNEFERMWSDWVGAKHSLFVTSGSTANLLLLDAVREQFFSKRRQIKVLLPACTWVTNINPVMQLGMTPVFCDINLHDYSFDSENMQAIARKHEIDVVFITHLLGLPANRQQIRDVFPRAVLLDDACESHGVRDHRTGHRIGANETGATFSFYFGHHMSTIEGGMISTDDTALYDLMMMKRSHGLSRVSMDPQRHAALNPEIDPQFLFVTSGYNFRNTEPAAVLGISQLKRLDDVIAVRQRNYARYQRIMGMTDLFHVPADHAFNSSFCLPLVAKEKATKNQLIDLLRTSGVEYRPIVGGNLLRQPYMKGHSISCNAGPYNVDMVHENGIYIGNNQFVGTEELDQLRRIITAI